ncbi:MAG: hypothetical protein IJ602_00515 [Paludibacteraceae bacterium]|nr:hypothetical protein [Paludibacteraceae bacterium]
MRNLFTKITLLLCALLLSVNMLGNTVSSANSSSDVKNGKIEMKGNHATFYLSNISKYEENWRSSWAYVIGTVKKSSSKTLTLSWTTDGDYDIKVTNIRFYAKAYTSGEWAVHNGKIIVAGSEYTIGTIRIETGGFDEINESGNFTSDINIVCKNNESGGLGYSFDYFIKDITITYTATPKIKTKKGNVEVTICPEAPKTIDLNTCLTNKDNHLSYTFSCTAEGANIEETTFSASRIGDYTVNVSVEKKSNCHEAASTTFKVTVTPAALTLTAPTASDITYRQALSASDLTGGSAKVGSCVVDGSWAWKASTTVPSMPGDDQPFPVVFTPSENAGNYTNFETTASVDVKRARFVFDGSGDEADDPNHVTWCYDDNWEENHIPGSVDEVLIEHNVVIRQQVSAYSVTINEGDTLTIMPTGGLTVGAGGIIGATTGNLILKAGTEGETKGQTGYLRISPEYTGAMPEATVELFSIGYYNKAERETQKAAWQVVGAPIADAGVAAKSVYTKSWIYSWDEATNNWVNNRATLTFSPFVGYETTQYKDAAGMKLSYTGTLVSGAGERTEDLTFSTDGYNALANSYAAPIDISRFSTSDFINAEPTISVLNTGTQEQSENPGEDVNAPGKFLSIPVANAAEMASTFGYPLIIPSMQGFFVKATGNDAKIKLDYNRLVWNANYSDLRENKPLRAPKNTKDEQEELGSLKVTITANGWTDHVYILESENYDDMYESGYDARKMMSGDMDIYTINGEEQLSVNATNSIIGTRVGVRTGEETAYTLLFTHLNSETEIALLDSETGETTDINEGTEYTFFAAPETEITERFYIVERSNAPEIATDVDNVSGETKVQKFIKNGQMYILKNGVLYNATGAVVR